MNVRRLAAIVLVFGCVSVAWVILGSSILVRTDSGYRLMGEQVEELWGSAHLQRAPKVTLETQAGRSVLGELSSSDIKVDLKLDHRRKGLLWYATYAVGFDGTYELCNSLNEGVTATVLFEFPSSGAIYDNFEFRVDDESTTPVGGIGRGLGIEVRLEPGEAADIHIAYDSRGLDTWLYRFADEIVTVQNFRLTMNTDFDGFDFPERTISASAKTPTPQGWRLAWEFNNLVSDFDIGLEMPHKLNPGPLASRMSYFAPVSLMFFFTVLVVLGAVADTNLHPMHYFFLGAAFFAFHLLFAYLVDHLVVGLAFVVAAAASLLLVVSYLWRVVGRRFALREAAISQFLFLVLFSYAFFFEGYTGLVVTIGSVITLAMLMQVTATLNWEEVFRKGD